MTVNARVAFVAQEVAIFGGNALTRIPFVAQEAMINLLPPTARVAFVGQEVITRIQVVLVAIDLLSPIPKLRFCDAAGNALVGGKLFTYAAGTTTKLATYTDYTGGTPNANPIILDARGECSIWLTPGVAWKYTLSPASDTDPPTNPIWTVDQITAGLADLPFGVDGGTANNYLVTNVAGITSSFTQGQSLCVLIAHTNTGTSTLNANTQGAKVILDQFGNTLAAGALTANQPAIFISDGTNWRYQYSNSNSAVPYGVDGGAANAYVVSGVSGIASQAAGTVINIKITNTNTTTSTLNVNSLGVTTILDQFGNALVAGALTAGQVATFVSDGLNWRYYYIQATQNNQFIVNSITGLLPSSMGAGALTVTKGQASNSTGAQYITLAANTGWAVANGNAINGYQGGASLPSSSTIHFFVITGASGTATFASTSLAPTAPTGYAVAYRRIFSLNTDGSGNLLGGAAVEILGGAMCYYLTTQVMDANTADAPPMGSRTLVTLSVPTGIKVQPIVRTSSRDATIITSADETDVQATTPSVGAYGVWSGAPGYDHWVNSLTATPFLTTNTSGQIGVRASTVNSGGAFASGYQIDTRGWVDWRRT